MRIKCSRPPVRGSPRSPTARGCGSVWSSSAWAAPSSAPSVGLTQTSRTCRRRLQSVKAGSPLSGRGDRLKSIPMSTTDPSAAAYGSPPDAAGRFGAYGGRYVPETLMPALEELETAFEEAWADPSFRAELDRLLREYVGRPSPLSRAARLSEATGLNVSIKREDLNHTGAHKINNALGQCLLARRMGKKRIIAETGAGQHGVATATACALFGLECIVYMGEEDTDRQRLNVFRMKLLGASVHPVTTGTRTLKDAMNEAMRDWVTNVRTTHYVIGSAAGPHPYPFLVRELQRVIGDETRAQHQEMFGCLPDAAVACVGGGSNAIGFFAAFLNDPSVRLIGVEAAGKSLDSGEHAAPLNAG